MKSLETRRTIRKFKMQDVDDHILNSLFDLASRTQTMGNLQLYSVVVTRSEEGKARLSAPHLDQPMVTQAPVLLTVCADFNRTSQWCSFRKTKPGYNNLLSFFNAAIDALLFTQTFCNIAEEQGLGICYLGTTVYNPKAIIDILHLPLLVMPVATLAVGWPDENPPLTDRLPIESFVHKETYCNYNADSIDKYYAYKESLEENKYYCKINSKETLAQIFAEIRYTKEDNERMSIELFDALKQQGFI